MWLIYKPVDVTIDDDITRIFHVFEMQIGMNQSDHRILALQQLERPENFRGERGFEPRPLLLLNPSVSDGFPIDE